MEQGTEISVPCSSPPGTLPILLVPGNQPWLNQLANMNYLANSPAPRAFLKVLAFSPVVAVVWYMVSSLAAILPQ